MGNAKQLNSINQRGDGLRLRIDIKENEVMPDNKVVYFYTM